MSYAFVSKMNKDCPCEKDCPRRTAGCAIDCPDWAVYRAKRLELYDKRAAYAARNHQTAGFETAMRRAQRREIDKRNRG